MTARTRAAARAGDEGVFRELTEPYRHALQLHCYRIVGSTQDAEDLVQETMLAAWRGLDQFTERASIRTWLYRIATNRCIDALRAGARRPQPAATMTEFPEPSRIAEPVWLEPYPDVLLEWIADETHAPAVRYETKEAVALALRAGLQHLPPQQRAVLVLRDVLGFQAAEVAEILATSPAAANSLLARARAALDSRLPAAGRERAPMPNASREREIVGRFADAVEAGDVDAVVATLTDDAWVTMPPQPFEYQGHAAITRFLRDRDTRRGGPLRLVATRANGQPAFGCYFPSPHTDIARPYGLPGRLERVLRDRAVAGEAVGSPRERACDHLALERPDELENETMDLDRAVKVICVNLGVGIDSGASVQLGAIRAGNATRAGGGVHTERALNGSDQRFGDCGLGCSGSFMKFTGADGTARW